MNEFETYHVIPNDDILEHQTDKYCRCNPSIDVYENGVVVCHTSFDLREEDHPQEN